MAFDAGSLDEETRAAIFSGVSAAHATMAEQARNIGNKVNGWASSAVFGNREWYAGSFLLRAVAAMVGWGGNDAIEALYPIARKDMDGHPLHGAHRYQMSFTTIPPARAFWSVTMCDTSYDGTAGYLVAKPMGRYLVNSTTPGLAYGEDGSLTIMIPLERGKRSAAGGTGDDGHGVEGAPA